MNYKATIISKYLNLELTLVSKTVMTHALLTDKYRDEFENLVSEFHYRLTKMVDEGEQDDTD